MRYFVIRGFNVKQDSKGKSFDFERVDRELIAPALAQCEFEGGTTAQMDDAGSIHEDMFALILEADVVVCDITVHNPNVFYELGVRHALRKKGTVLIKDPSSADPSPFDIGGFRYLGYDAAAPAATVAALAGAIRAGQRSLRETDSPVFKYLPALPEAPSDAAVPPDFASEVRRARAAGDRGWLLMLAEDLRQLRFERAGLHQVAFAQLWLEDFEAARENLERLLKLGETDVKVQFALANIYERIYRRTNKAEYFERSQQAIEQALQRENLTPGDHAEALSLTGRNLKTQWRKGLEGKDSTAARRAAACRRQLLDSYDAYREAYGRDLNSFYSGVACLQVGHTLLSLSAEARWVQMFKSARDAQRRCDDLADELPRLGHAVAAAIEHGQQYGSENDRKWALISQADLRFLRDDEGALEADPSGLVEDYEHALQGLEAFYRGAAIGQLELFEAVGVRGAVARQVIAALKGQAPPAVQAPVKPHLVVFAGHAVDAPDRPAKRFPASAEARARELIRDRLTALQTKHGALRVLASAAPGADILAHEVCTELGVPTVLCLPMAAKDVAALSFGALDDWRNRLLALAQRHGDSARVLQDSPELPRWLDERRSNRWERGNRWMMRSAQAWDCSGRTLLALWEKDESDQRTGGTAHLVRLAREAGVFEFDIIDSRALLAP